MSEFSVNAPVARLVRVRQRRSSDWFAKTHVIEFWGLSRQADLDIAQALSIGQLRECHRSVLLGAAKRPHPSVATAARNSASARFAGIAAAHFARKPPHSPKTCELCVNLGDDG